MGRRGGDDVSGAGTSWLVLRHSPAEGLGLLAGPLRDLGIQHRHLDLRKSEPTPRDLRDLGGLIVLGGAMAVYDTERHPFLATEAALVESALTAGRPVLGICLGAQLIAQVLGARVYPGERREVGWAPVTLTDDGVDDSVFGSHPKTLSVFHMHGDTYELPPDARRLAGSSLYEQQAFRWGDVVYGIQYHLEFTEPMIKRLTTEPETRAYITEAGADPDAIMRETPQGVEGLAPVADEVFSSFFRQCGF